MINDDQCWTYRLADYCAGRFRFRNVSVPGMDSNQLLSLARDYYAAIKPDVVVLQVGIVDCYPRAIKKAELSILLRLPSVISRAVHRLVKRFYARLIVARGIRYVQPAAFRANLQTLSEIFEGARIMVVPIAPPSQTYQAKNPRIASSVDEYNALLSSLFTDGFLQECYPQGAAATIFLSDNHHLNAAGNGLVFEAVKKQLDALEADR
ncbi:GDSL-type esterase/lipase family protein [Pseudomonas stutzeri]|uniref:SGNH/GDSL hydrolase family protein n=1 Tax=Stutzerimonas nitrititolerans TaxID=2482751 RepID=UPI00289634BE|nr:GDSL-type esterase/lipase family protein [Stutzerimonas nitrititolerans]MCQ4233465.1 GDSL-type esterase/lipase family protein [Stutzerimonas degradans]